MQPAAQPAARPAGREWSVEEAAVYAARRDYELLRLLSRDKNALRAARLLGVQLGQQHLAVHSAAAERVRKPKFPKTEAHTLVGPWLLVVVA